MNKPFHIIVADDDDDDQFIITEALKETAKGIVNITSVYDGKQLIDCLNKKGLFAEHKGNADLIIMDINMPILNGLETLKHIKNSDTYKSIPVYMLSTLRTIDRVDTSMQLGALGYYSKPNQMGDYKNIFQEMLQNTLFSNNKMIA